MYQNSLSALVALWTILPEFHPPFRLQEDNYNPYSRSTYLIDPVPDMGQRVVSCAPGSYQLGSQTAQNSMDPHAMLDETQSGVSMPPPMPACHDPMALYSVIHKEPKNR